MKRTAELFRAGTPSARQPIKFYGFRGVGNRGRRGAASTLIRTDVGRLLSINNWRDGEPLIEVKRPDPFKPSAKKFRRQMAEFTAWCDYVRARFNFPITEDAKVQAIVHQLVPKYQHLNLKGAANG